MSKTISDRDYLERFIYREHFPITRDFGSQRDPEIVIICYCGSNATDLAVRESYNQHIVRILDQEFNFLDKGQQPEGPGWHPLTPGVRG